MLISASTPLKGGPLFPRLAGDLTREHIKFLIWLDVATV